MSVVHFVTVLGLLGGSRVLQTSSWYLCDSSINDYDVCNSNGMAAYVSYGATDPPQPSVFYPVSETNLTFTQKFVNNVLGVDLTQQALVSGKFSGIFIPTESGNYSFALFLNHKSSVGTKFSVSSTTGIIDMDLSAGGTAYNETCEYWDTDNCTLSDEVTNCLVCNRTFELTENGEYSLFAGLNESVGVPYAGNLYVGLTFTSPSGTTRYVTDADAVVSLTALVSRAENAARARKESAVIISTSVGSSLLGFMIIAAIITIILVKRKGTDNDRKRDRFAKGKENARSSMENSAESYAKSDRNSINDGSTKSHAKSNKNSINDGSTRSHAKSNKNSINYGSIKGDAENSRRSSARDSSNAGRNSSRRGSAGGNAKTDSKGNKESSVRDSSKVGRKSSRRGSAGGNTRADSKGNTKSSVGGNTKAGSKVVRKMVLEGV